MKTHFKSDENSTLTVCGLSTSGIYGVSKTTTDPSRCNCCNCKWTKEFNRVKNLPKNEKSVGPKKRWKIYFSGCNKENCIIGADKITRINSYGIDCDGSIITFISPIGKIIMVEDPIVELIDFKNEILYQIDEALRKRGITYARRERIIKNLSEHLSTHDTSLAIKIDLNSETAKIVNSKEK